MSQDTPARPPVTVGKLLRALRAFSLPASVGPVLVATAAAESASRWRWDVMVISALGAAMLHLAGNLLNDYFDFRSGVDSKADDDPSRPGRLLVRRELLPGDVLAEALACLLLGGLAAAYLVWQVGPALLWFALAGAGGLYAYTGPPFRLKYHAAGEPLIFVVFGPLLMTAAAWAQTGGFNMRAFALSIPVGLATTAILAGNSYRDRLEDSQAGIRTLGQFAHGQVARAAYVALVLASVVGIAAIGLSGLGPKMLVLAPAALVLLHKPLAAMYRGRRLPDIDVHTARFEGVLLLLVFAAYVLWPVVGPE